MYPDSSDSLSRIFIFLHGNGLFGEVSWGSGVPGISQSLVYGLKSAMLVTLVACSCAGL